MDLVVKGGRLVSGETVDVLVDRGLIVDIQAEIPVGAEEVLDATGLVVSAGFVDSHRHVWQAPLRGVGADMTLGDYFEAILGRALDGYSPDDAHRATLLGATEALNAGITTVFDWCNVAKTPEHLDAVLDAYEQSGIRAVVAHAGPGQEADAPRMAALTGRVTGALGVLGPQYDNWDLSTRQLRLAEKLGLVASMHFQGGDGSPLARMRDEGLVGPRTQFVHVNGMTGEEARILAGEGAGVTVTPVVEGTMGHGASPYTRLLAAGGRCGLGTDVVVNAPGDLFEPMRDTLRRHRAESGTMAPAKDVLRAATVDSAAAIGLPVGVLAPGRPADLVLLSGLRHVGGDVAGALVTTAGPADVHTVVVDGRIVRTSTRRP